MYAEPGVRTPFRATAPMAQEHKTFAEHRSGGISKSGRAEDGKLGPKIRNR